MNDPFLITGPAVISFSGGRTSADREDYATMARDVRDQGVLPMTWLEEAMPCTSGGCGI